MVDAQTVSIVFAGLSIGIAAIYYTLTLRNSQRAQRLQLETRQAQLFAQINDMTTTPQYLDDLKEVLSWTWDDFDDFLEKYGEENPDNWYKLISVMIPLNHLGMLLNEGLIDPMLLWHWRGPVHMIWDKFEPVIFEYRRRFESPPKGRLYEFIEDLNITMRETRETDTRNFDERLARRKRRREALGMPTY